MKLSWVLSLLLPALARAFVPVGRPQTSLSLLAASRAEDSSIDRRQALQQATALVSGALLAPSIASAAIGSSPEQPIVVLGAGGRVGKLCVEILANKGLYCKAVTRNGRVVVESPYVSAGVGDVTKLDLLQPAVNGASGVIFAASASGKKKGGDPAHVDYLGCVNTAKACLAAKVPKLAVVSSGCVTRPNSAGFKATNFFVKYIYGDNIMGYKLAGENAIRDLYAGQSDCAYTIARAGGLSDKESVGPSKIHVSQGDVYSSEIPRVDVAAVVVAALLKGKDTDNTTFELNTIEGLNKAEASLPDLPAELIHTGASNFDGAVAGLLSDASMKSKYSSILTDFTGGEILPLEQLV